MSIPISQKVDLLYKQAFGVTKTDTEANKSPSNEAIASPLLNRGDTLWTQADQIPGVAACLLYTSPSPRDRTRSRMPSSA